MFCALNHNYRIFSCAASEGRGALRRRDWLVCGWVPDGIVLERRVWEDLWLGEE